MLDESAIPMLIELCITSPLNSKVAEAYPSRKRSATSKSSNFNQLCRLFNNQVITPKEHAHKRGIENMAHL